MPDDRAERAAQRRCVERAGERHRERNVERARGAGHLVDGPDLPLRMRHRVAVGRWAALEEAVTRPPATGRIGRLLARSRVAVQSRFSLPEKMRFRGAKADNLANDRGLPL